MIDQSLQLRLTQKLALAPQLQQAIRLLQLTRIELREYLQETIEANPLLEQAEPGDVQDPAAEAEWEQSDQAASDTAEADSWDQADDWGEDYGLGNDWGEPESYAVDREQQIAETGSGGLVEHLLFQIGMAQFKEQDAAIATAIVYALDEDGYLLDSLEEIAASLAPEYHVDPSQVDAVLRRIQRMEPVGVASRDPGECIRVQLDVLPASTPERDTARRIARDFLDLVVAGDTEEMARALAVDEERLEAALDLIRSLEPRPGARYDHRADESLVPDVYVREVEGRWVTSLSPDNDPRLKLNKYYVQLLRKASAQDRKYLEGRLQ